MARSTVFVCVPCEGALLSLVEIQASKLSLQPEALGADQEGVSAGGGTRNTLAAEEERGRHCCADMPGTNKFKGLDK